MNATFTWLSVAPTARFSYLLVFFWFAPLFAFKLFAVVVNDDGVFCIWMWRSMPCDDFHNVIAMRLYSTCKRKCKLNFFRFSFKANFRTRNFVKNFWRVCVAIKFIILFDIWSCHWMSFENTLSKHLYFIFADVECGEPKFRINSKFVGNDKKPIWR